MHMRPALTPIRRNFLFVFAIDNFRSKWTIVWTECAVFTEGLRISRHVIEDAFPGFFRLR